MNSKRWITVTVYNATIRWVAKKVSVALYRRAWQIRNAPFRLLAVKQRTHRTFNFTVNELQEDIPISTAPNTRSIMHHDTCTASLLLR